MTTTMYRGQCRRGQTYFVSIDHARDSLLTEFGKATLRDRYLMPGERPQDLFARVACYFSDNEASAQRVYDYISKLWFMPSTPVLSNGGTDRGLPISCFLNSVPDSLQGINDTWQQNLWLAARGGGIGTNWSDVRSIGEKIGQVGESSGVIPFIKVMDSVTLAISQGSLRRGSAAVYMDDRHPEIEEFVELRRTTGGDVNRRCMNIHHGVMLSDEFMEAVKAGATWELRSPVSGEAMKTIKARDLWQRIIQTRMETGEPYIVFSDTVARMQPEHHKKLGLKVKSSNLCAEIMLPTGVDHNNKNRTAVCCLSSANLETYDQWRGNTLFLRDVLVFLDNVLEDFIARTADVQGFEDARYAAMQERSIGLGVMGFQSMCQKNGIAMEGPVAKSWNRSIFKWLKKEGDRINEEVATERGPCPDAKAAGAWKRWSHMFAIAPTASISIICGGTSPCTEAYPANIFTQKTLSGSYTVKNPYLQKVLELKWDELTAGDNPPLQNKEHWVADQWRRVLNDEGSVRHLSHLTDYEKKMFATAFEIDPRWVIEHAADRAPYVCQAVSNNLFLTADAQVRDVHFIHFKAWEMGVKSLYYCRSKSLQRAEVVSHMAGELPQPTDGTLQRTDYDECLACQ